jgi:signal transduction histidine kinase
MTVGRPIGVMAAVFKKIGYVPPQEDIEFAELVAERCAMAIAADAAIAEYGRLLAAEQEAHRAATAKAAQMEALLESLECGVVVYDRNGYVMLTNRACEEMLDVGKPQSRYGDDIAFGITLEKLDGEAVSLKEMPYCKLLREGTLADQHYIMHYTDGSYRVMSFNGGIVRDAKGQMSSAIIIMRDITRMYEMEKTREEMIRLISHDLRSPLTLILARAQMMERVADKPDTVRKNAMGIVLSARYMNIMISDLSDSFRIQSGKITLKRQVFDLAKFMSDCVERWLDAPETTRLKLDIEPNLPPVYADPVRLERILTNLTTNAFKYSTGDSEVLVEAARYHDSDDQALISITDHGQGIAEDELPHIFERYWRASEARERSEGMGLGLYICKELVEAHGGRIWVRSVQGQGSTFFFTVPFAG